MANKLKSKLQEQYQEMIEEQNTSRQNFVDYVVSREDSAKNVSGDNLPTNDTPDSKEPEQEVRYINRSYTLDIKTKQKLRIRVRTEHTSIKEYINNCLEKFFHTQDYSRRSATPEEYQKLQNYEDSLGKKELRVISMTEENIKNLDYWSGFYAVPKSVMMNYILEMFLK